MPEVAPLPVAKEMPVHVKTMPDLSADKRVGTSNLSLPEGVSMGQGGRLLMTDFGAGTGKVPLTKALLGNSGGEMVSGAIIGSYSGSRGFESRYTGDARPFLFIDQQF